MNHLHKLTPAETYLVLHHSDVDMKNLLKYTFMDLLLRGVLEVAQIGKESRATGKMRYSTYVIHGKKFMQSIPAEHETIFLEAYAKSSTVKVLFKHLVKMGYENAGSKRSFLFKKLMKSPQLEGLFNESFFYRLLARPKLTPMGIEFRKELKAEMEKIDRELADLIKKDPSRALELLSRIHGNVFLLVHFDRTLISEIDPALLSEFHKENLKHAINSNGCSTFYWDDYASHGHSFDSNYDSVDASSSGCGTSGCSSCSGCSGCGGCGGCS